ncbi:hypothetical protein MKW94_018427 [Papaver nudicaule]|uniref:RRM domain-containing protein n=1 Tax=Papaver nudicaule TaxID=74823 RepID=A0AA41VRV5_PAPNU|nr:hypothetical protein [Papaver nudicaule]
MEQSSATQEDIDFRAPAVRGLDVNDIENIIERRSWPRFGDGGAPPAMTSTEEIFIEDTKVGRDPWRTCGRKGHHLTSECRFKDLSDSVSRHMAGTSKTGGYIRTGQRYEAKQFGRSEKRPMGNDINEENTVRVHNLTDDIHGPDLLKLFSTIGAVNRVHVAVNRNTGMSRGFGYVNFVNMEDADRAINELDEYEYGDNKILRVEWAPPSAKAFFQSAS